MQSLTYTLLADGSSDEVLIPIINWAIVQHCPNLSISYHFAKNLGPIGTGLCNRVAATLRAYPCELLFIHRDTESNDLKDFNARLAEIDLAVDSVSHNYVPIVPIRMTEAWLLTDEDAIRAAAGNQAGKADLKIPPKKNWESIADPKKILFDALITATEKSGRALRKFSPEKQRARVTALTHDFSRLRGLSSFDHFENQLRLKLNNF